MGKIVIAGKTFAGYEIAMEKASLLVIKAEHGYLACGYINLAVADKFQEHAALVTGVKTFDDMLNAKVSAVSAAAAAAGVAVGMSGRDALLKMQ